MSIRQRPTCERKLGDFHRDITWPHSPKQVVYIQESSKMTQHFRTLWGLVRYDDASGRDTVKRRTSGVGILQLVVEV